MCLVISIEAPHDQRDSLLAAAALASKGGVRIDVAHPLRWPWAHERPVVAKLTEDGGCSCSLLSDNADFDAGTWELRSDVIPAVVASLRTLLARGSTSLRISALWIGETPQHVEYVEADQFLARIASNRFATKTAYVVALSA